MRISSTSARSGEKSLQPAKHPVRLHLIYNGADAIVATLGSILAPVGSTDVRNVPETWPAVGRGLQHNPCRPAKRFRGDLAGQPQCEVVRALGAEQLHSAGLPPIVAGPAGQRRREHPLEHTSLVHRQSSQSVGHSNCHLLGGGHRPQHSRGRVFGDQLASIRGHRLCTSSGRKRLRLLSLPARQRHQGTEPPVNQLTISNTRS
mmetsp:Transcript_32561/g.93768  ORF Transcript_32561/g.93768 Transcript_32561/m.93768 type:complete len:204 (+) Transcript_32561:973-1584(+)